MRLLSDDQQKIIWDRLYDDMRIANLPFDLHRANFRTIDGQLEAYYAVLATNFIAGNIGVDLM
jgi:hypothetical protein